MDITVDVLRWMLGAGIFVLCLAYLPVAPDPEFVYWVLGLGLLQTFLPELRRHLPDDPIVIETEEE